MTARSASALGKPGLVKFEVVAHLGIGIDDLADAPRRYLVLLMFGGGGAKALDIPLVRVDEEPHHRHGVVGLVLDVRQHEHAGLLGGAGEAVEAEREDTQQKDRKELFHDPGWTFAFNRNRFVGSYFFLIATSRG